MAFADLQSKFMTAMGDGNLDPVERAQLRGALNEHRDLLNAFDAKLAVANSVRAVRS